jgi:excisionase family DNA binding protein
MPKVAPAAGSDRLLTVEEAAERLGTSVHFPRQLIKEKRIRYVKLGPGRRSPVRIRADVLEQFIGDHTVEASG